MSKKPSESKEFDVRRVVTRPEDVSKGKMSNESKKAVSRFNQKRSK